MQQKRVTLKDIARATGVHVSTVSRALNPTPSASLTEDVVQRIRATARQMGYSPNLSAFSLRTNRTMTVGVLIPDITNPIFPPILRGIESVLDPLGYASLIVNTDNRTAREKSLLESLRGRGVDGIIHAGVLERDRSLADDLLFGVPMVTVNRRVSAPNIPCVVNDDEQGIGMILQHLIDLGHRNVVHIAGPILSSTGHQRREAFLKEARAHDLLTGPGAVFEAAAYDEAPGAECARAAMRARPDTTALLCANDRLAIGAIRALSELGMSCPRDISVTGFNDMPMVDMIPPGLTTIRIRSSEVGKAAGSLLAKMMTEPHEVVPSQIIMPVAMVLRNSTAKPREAVRSGADSRPA